ncbi:MAG TPA: class I SAM-dependent methyltransferase [Lamprocystis sp. (in: g-proteobacteria)]|nr:class I SAM-dependent methyltransferase [Lamprocystis sp. (in: g-proteobacteria)]
MSQCATVFGASAPDRLSRLIQKRVYGDRVKIPLEVRLWGGRTYRFGAGEPAVKILVKDRKGLSALRRLDELRICEAYMNGSLDVLGDMLGFASLRTGLHDRRPLHDLWRRLTPWLVGRITTDRHAIAAHYDFASDFYLRFLDPTRCYSQAVFERDDEPLETAQRRKLDFAIDACRLKPGDRVLDVGGGWGSLTEHAGQRGIEVTSLTISRESENFLNDLIDRRRLPCRVVNQDFLAYRSPEPYDAIVILGVMEHLPNYPAVLRQFQRLLKPAGRVYLDASASRDKYDKPSFIARYIFPADHAFLCLHDFLRAVAKTPMEVLAVYNDRHNYFLTCRAWAENLEAAREDIIARWGETLYRRFRLYLWGSAQAFLSRGAEAFRVVLERPLDA